jgi:hypothetical protein
MNSDKTLSNTELELTQKIQMHFPRGVISAGVLKQWNGCKAEIITACLTEAFSKGPKIIKSEPLLKFLYTTRLPAITGNFIVEERFSLKNTEVKFSEIGRNFIAWFGNVVEESIGESELSVQQLQKNSVDRPIIDELGGLEKAGIFLQQIWLFMREKQAKGETDGWFVAYREDKVRFPEDEPFAYANKEKEGGRSVLRAVYFGWDGDGWSLSADQVSDPGGWSGGFLILSSNSLAA